MKLKHLLFFIFCTFLVTYSQNKVGFDVDYAKFKYDNESVYLELYYSFSQNSLQKRANDSAIVISANLQVILTDDSSKQVVNESYNLNSAVDTNSANYVAEDLIGVLGFQVSGGNYDLTVSVKDNFGSGESNTLTEKIDLSNFSISNPSISDIQLCSKIIQDGADPNSIYYKNSLETIPNPKTLYGSNLPILFYYLELYADNTSESTKYKFKRELSHNKIIDDTHEEDVILSNDAIVKAGFINLSKYTSGRYTLTTHLVDSIGTNIATSSKNIFVFNPQNNDVSTFQDAKLGYIKSEFGILAEEECDYNFEVSKYIAAESEKDLYESLKDIESKRKFLYEFWTKRDNIPETRMNEFKQEYMSRVDYVNSNFGHRLRKGYKTDRGRIALIYGIPDAVDTRTNDSELKGYEVWNYDGMEGGVVFIFGDTMGVAEYELLHSTKRGEVYNKNWQSRLYIKGGF